jgi:hypothetical protein
MNTKDGVVWPGTVARVVQCLPGKHDALSSNTSTIKKEKKNTALLIIFSK